MNRAEKSRLEALQALRPYTISEVMALTGFSRPTIIRQFERERGVLILDSPETMHKRGRRTIRIPRAVFERVIRGLTV